MKKICFLLLSSYFLHLTSTAQPERWQQHVKYTMNVDVDVNTNRLTGTQKLEYTNNSPDILNRVFYHLYWNAFQPNSMMDVRSRELGKIIINGKPDWDSRVQDRISKLSPAEIGYQKIKSLKMNGVPQPFKYYETILEVDLTKPILPKSKVVFEMEFEAQVPLQIRRSGRDNPLTLVRYTMTQWYPKLCEYDYEGWHPTPYVAREFYGVWGDYDVTISIDKNYVLGGSGTIQNKVGFGYENTGTEVLRSTGNKSTWHFIAPNVHDFAWAADPEYKHIVRQIPGGPMINILYNGDPSEVAFNSFPADGRANYNNSFSTYAASWDKQWEQVADAAVIVYPYMKKMYGEYPYKQYSFIQGGDGSMEYPNCTMIINPSLGAAFHEWMHSWYQMMLGTNESVYPWMDEGFTSYAENEVTAYYNAIKGIKKKPRRRSDTELPLNHTDAYTGYFALVRSDLQEPLSTHADHYNTNVTYTINAYSKGEIFLDQLGYIVGDDIRNKILLEYYKLWKFKHPNPSDFIKVAEDVSNVKLDWYKEYWIYTTKTIDYGIDSLWEDNGVSKIRLKRVGEMPMPIDLELRFKDGTSEQHYIPLNLMFGEKPAENNSQRVVHEEWPWTNPTYIVEFKHKLTDLKEAEIDPSRRMADVERKNNLLQLNW